MIDNGYLVDILHSHSYQRMDLEGRRMEVGQESQLYGFSNDLVHVVRNIKLPVTFDITPRQVQVNIKIFMV